MRKILRRTNRPKELDISNRILVEPEDYDLMPDLCDGGATAAIIGAGLSAAAGVGSAAINAGAKWGSRTYMRVAKEMANYNTQLNESMYNKYQSPQALMRQYKEAGLNPNLIYGQSTSGAGNLSAGQVSTNPNDYASDRGRYGEALEKIAGAYSVYQDIIAKNSQINNTEAVTANVNAERDYKKLMADGKAIENQYTASMMQSQLEGYAIENAHRAIKLENDRIYSAEERKAGLLKTKEEIEDIRMSAKEKAKNIEKVDWDIKGIEQSIEESKGRIKHMTDTIALGYGNLAVAQQNASSNYMNALANSGRFNIESQKWEASRDNYMNAQEYNKFTRTGQFPAGMSFWEKANFQFNRMLDRVPFINAVSAFNTGNK